MENSWQIKSRQLLLSIIFALITTPFLVGLIFPDFFNENPSLLTEISFDYIFYIVWGGLIYFLAKTSSIDWYKLIGRINKDYVSWTYLLIALQLIAISLAGIYIVFYPLSFLLPDVVNSIMIETDINFYWFSGSGYRLANFFSFFSIVFITPTIEEIFFRGFLLTSLSIKFGTRKGVLISSSMFALFHFDPIGSMIFGIVLSVIYLKTNSLIAPLIIHFLNNMIAFFSAYFIDYFNSNIEYTLIDFQSDLWLGIIGFAIGVPWLIYFYSKEIKGKKFNVPYNK